MKKINKIKIVENLVLVLFLIITLIIMKHHELWRDEAQQWLLVKSLNIKELFGQLAAEGHPCLWYLVLKVYYICGFSYTHIGYLSWGLAALASILLVKKTNINIFIKIACLFSINFIFYCSVLSRSYSLLLLEIVALCILYPKRKESPIAYNLILFFTANTHILSLGLILSLILLDFFDLFIKKDHTNYKYRLMGCGITILGILFVFLQLHGAASNSFGVIFSTSIKELISSISHFFIRTGESQIGIGILCNIAAIFFVYFIIWLIISKKYRQLMIISCSIGFQLFVYLVYKNIPNYTTTMSFFTLLLVYFTLHDEKNNISKFATICILIIFCCTIYCSFIQSYREIKYKYSDSYSIATYINQNIDEKEKIYCEYSPICLSIEPYVVNTFIDVRDFKRFTYEDLFKKDDFRSFDEEMFNKLTKENGRYVILFNVVRQNSDYIDNLKKNGKIKKIYQTSEKLLSNDSYLLIEISY